MSTLEPGKSITLAAAPCAGKFDHPVVWTNNARLLEMEVIMEPAEDGLTCVITIPEDVKKFGIFAVYAQSGSKQSSYALAVKPTCGLKISVVA